MPILQGAPVHRMHGAVMDGLESSIGAKAGKTYFWPRSRHACRAHPDFAELHIGRFQGDAPVHGTRSNSRSVSLSRTTRSSMRPYSATQYMLTVSIFYCARFKMVRMAMDVLSTSRVASGLFRTRVIDQDVDLIVQAGCHGRERAG